MTPPGMPWVWRGLASALGVLLLASAPASAEESATDDATDPPEATTAAAGPTTQATVYFNARMALREDRPFETLRLWFLRTAIESRDRVVSAYDGDFHSIAWAALGIQGFCPDGLPPDAVDDPETDAPGAGVGLWPLALHNWAVRNRRGQPPGLGGAPFQAYRVGRQARWVALFDVLDAGEIKSLRLRRTGCWWDTQLVQRVADPWKSLEDPKLASQVLRSLLRQALSTLHPTRVIGRAAIEARIFDINLRLAAIAERERRRARRRAAAESRNRGLSRSEARDAGQDAKETITADSESGRILRRSLRWSAEEWLTLSRERRAFLFAQAAKAVDDPPGVQARALAITDRLLDRHAAEIERAKAGARPIRRADARGGVGAEIQGWLGHASLDIPAGGPTTPAQASLEARRAVWAGPRGVRLMTLDRSTGFRERGVIALHRGVDALGDGRMAEALRSLAYALRWAEDSRDAERVQNLARRWLSFVAAQFTVTDELLAMLRSVVPRADYAAVLEDQMWQAALSADIESFDRCLRNQQGRGALRQRGAALRPLAEGDAGAFATQLSDQLEESPYFATRMINQFVERLEAQDADIRNRYIPLLLQLRRMMVRHIEAQGDRPQRKSLALLDRIRALLDGMIPLTDADSAADRAHGLSPERKLFAGSVRLAPSDPLPWPFRPPEVRAPSIFVPLELVPEEWRRADGTLIYGWRVRER